MGMTYGKLQNDPTSGRVHLLDDACKLIFNWDEPCKRLPQSGLTHNFTELCHQEPGMNSPNQDLLCIYIYICIYIYMYIYICIYTYIYISCICVTYRKWFGPSFPSILLCVSLVNVQYPHPRHEEGNWQQKLEVHDPVHWRYSRWATETGPTCHFAMGRW